MAVQLDQYLAVAYFQQGVSNFLSQDFEEALANFNDTLLYLRGNRYIDYEQLGLPFKLHSCEALFNRGLCFINIGQKDTGIQDLIFAAREKVLPDHDVIDDAIQDHAEGYTVFSIPVGVVYRPNAAKVKNLRARDYLPRAKLVAQQQNAQYTHRRQMSAQDLFSRDQHNGSWAAMNMVKPGLTSRTRQHSEPPMMRSMLPPTPPPDSLKPFPPLRIPIDISQSLKLDTTANARGTHPNTQHPSARADPSHGRARQDSAVDSSKASFNPSALVGGHLPGQWDFATHEKFSKPARSPESSMQNSPRPETVSSHPFSIAETPEIETPSNSPSESNSSGSPNAVGGPIFEMLTKPHGHLPLRDYRQTTYSDSLHRTQSERGESRITLAERRRAGSATRRRAESYGRPSRRAPPIIKRIRAKVHSDGDMRFVMVDADAGFEALIDVLRTKLGLPQNAQGRTFKVKFRDEEGDLVTMADDEDWAMAVEMARQKLVTDCERGRNEGSEIGRSELWVVS